MEEGKKLHKFKIKGNVQLQDNFLAKEIRENEKEKKVYEYIASTNQTSERLL